MLNLFHSIHKLSLYYEKKIIKPDVGLIDICLALCIFALDDICNFIYLLLPILTKYYPFSLLYQDKLFHYQHQSLRKIIYKIEADLRKKKEPILFLTNTWDRYFLTINGRLPKKTKFTDDEIKIEIMRSLKFDDNDVFVRRNNSGIVSVLIARDRIN